MRTWLLRQIFFTLLVLGVFPASAATEHWLVRTSPLGWVAGEPNLRMDRALNDRWILGLEGGVIQKHSGDIDLRASTVGAVAAYYLGSVFEDGTYFDFGLVYSRERAKDLATGASSQFENRQIRARVGYHWFFEWANFNLGAGLATNSAGKVQINDATGAEVRTYEVRPVRLVLDLGLGVHF